MNKKIGITILALLAFIALVIAATWWLRSEPDRESMNGCSVHNDCLVVQEDYCGGAIAINQEYQDVWARYLWRLDVYYSLPWNQLWCKQRLPLQFFVAQCVDHRCATVQTTPEVTDAQTSCRSNTDCRKYHRCETMLCANRDDVNQIISNVAVAGCALDLTLWDPPGAFANCACVDNTCQFVTK